MKRDNQSLIEQFSFLRDAPTAVKEQFQQHVLIRELPAGATVCWEGDQCQQLAIVLEGTVRVYKVGENGRELTLYRLEASESCVLTASCILSNSHFPALAVTETAVRAALIPAPILRRWTEQHGIWREYVFGLMAQRLATVITTVEEIAFRRVDVRIANFLVQHSSNTLAITHQEIAAELGTAREVVSRILKDYEREQLVALSRGTITILNRPALHAKTIS